MTRISPCFAANEAATSFPAGPGLWGGGVNRNGKKQQNIPKPTILTYHLGGGVNKNNMKQKKKPKSTLFADKTQGLITTKQTKPRQVASAAPHPRTDKGILLTEIYK